MHDLCRHSAGGMISACTKPLRKSVFLVLWEAQFFPRSPSSLLPRQSYLLSWLQLLSLRWRLPNEGLQPTEHCTNTTNLPTKHIHKFLKLHLSSMRSTFIKMCSFNPSLSYLYKWHHHLPTCSHQKSECHSFPRHWNPIFNKILTVYLLNIFWIHLPCSLVGLLTLPAFLPFMLPPPPVTSMLRTFHVYIYIYFFIEV